MFNYQRILKDCFWDLALSSDDIKNIVDCDDTKKINMLFEKIFLIVQHSLAVLAGKNLEPFSLDELEKNQTITL